MCKQVELGLVWNQTCIGVFLIFEEEEELKIKTLQM
jgi:hypothetical protein